MANGNGNGLKPLLWILGVLVTISIGGFTGIGGALFNHESRISKNESAVQRLDRLESKIDRVLDVLGAANVQP